MTTFQRVIKYCAIALAVFLIACIVGGAYTVLGLIAGVTGLDSAVGELKEYSITEAITDIKIEVGAAEFTVAEGESFSLQSNLKNLEVNQKDGALTVTEEKDFFVNYNKSPVLKLIVPKGFVFENADITTGAGRVTVDNITADNLKLQLGAGKVDIKYLTANKKADIDGGAGKLTVENGQLCNLTLNMGVGELNLTSRLTGENELDYGVGAANLTLIGTVGDYEIEIDKGLGNASVDGKTVSDGAVIGQGNTKIEINCGVGNMQVNFE